MSESAENPERVFDYATPAARRATSLIKIHNPIQAQFVANMLERAGIQCIVLNPNSALDAALGYVPCELLVRPEDRDRAAEIIADLEAGRISVAAPTEEDADETDASEGEADDEPDPRCPKCLSWQVRRYMNAWHDFLRALHLRAPPAEGSTEYECLRCSHRWLEIVNENPRKK